MITNREQLIAAKRAVVITSLDHTALEKGQRIYLLECNGGALKLTKTGLYSHVSNRGSERSVSTSKKNDQVVLIFVHWDGDDGDPSRHPVDRIGLTLTLESCVVVTSLDDITWQEGRPLSVRDLHTPPS